MELFHEQELSAPRWNAVAERVLSMQSDVTKSLVFVEDRRI
jgi:hypothetical protein